MKAQGYGMVMVSSQVDEDVQHFYRRLGYQDCGALALTSPAISSPWS